MKNTGTQVIGIWDDHDYGINDGGDEFELKHVAREMIMDYLEEPLNSERRLEKEEAIHQDYVIWDNKGEFMIHIILLDNRFAYNKSTNERLGKNQWQWLDKALAN